MKIYVAFFLLFCLGFPSLGKSQFDFNLYNYKVIYPKDIKTGADQTEFYLPLLVNKSVGVVTNQTGTIGKTHIVDSLLKLNINIEKVFSPEHGFRGQASAGEHVNSGIDQQTGLAIISLYGSHKKPTATDLADIDIVLFDIQDVGARFYTYISTLHYLMEACAENNKELIVLDRPNPNGHYVDGPILKPEFSSFVGLDPIPIVHGMTVGEYAMMLNGEKWLKNGEQCNLTVIAIKNYSHDMLYQIPVSPSPNLPNMAAIYLYPSLCLFEGTVMSIGRGTNSPFQLYGHPDLTEYDTTFKPVSIAGKAPHPKYENQLCQGYYLSGFAESFIPNMGQLYLFWLVDSYTNLKDKTDFFQPFFDTLAGTDQLRKQIESGKTIKEIKDSWQEGLDNFKKIRKKYLLYPDV